MLNQSSIDQLAKASRRTALVSFLGLLVVMSSIIYSAAKLHSLEKRRSELNQEIESLNHKRQALQDSYDSLKSYYDALANEHPMQAIEQIQKTDPAQGMSPHVYIYTTAQSQLPKANEIANGFREKGFIVSGIENAGSEGFTPEQTEVRFFRYPEDKSDAQDILKMLQGSFGITNSRISYVLPDKAGATEARQFEIWFKKDPL
jgi:hypothetical protein